MWFLLHYTIIVAVNAIDQEQENCVANHTQLSELEALSKRFNVFSGKEPLQAIVYGDSIIELLDKNESPKALADMYIKNGRLLELEGSYGVAVNYYEKAYAIAEKCTIDSSQAFFGYRLANAERKQGNYHKALQLCYKNVNQAISIRDTLTLLRLYNCLGNIYTGTKEVDVAIKHYSEALKFSMALQDSVGIACVFNNLGIIYKQQGRYDKAMNYYRQALFWDKRKSRYRASSIHNIAELALLQGKLGLAYSKTHESLRIRQKARDKAGMMQSYTLLGKYYLSQDSLGMAQNYLFRALALTDSITFSPIVSHTYSVISKWYEKAGDYENALVYYRLYKKVKEGVVGKRQSQKMAVLEYQRQLQYEKKSAEIRRFWRFVIFSVMVVVFIVFLLIGIGRYRNRWVRESLEKKLITTQKKQIETDLEYKQKEVSMLILNQASMNNLIEDVKQQLSISKYKIRKENRSDIQGVINVLNNSLRQDVWKEFEMRFVEVHQDFYPELLKRFPDLTPNEQRLCAFLRLNMSSKEISSVTNQSVKSIETARCRLRKKMNLSGQNVSLTNYLTQV